ncbi:MAG: hypothetical protein LZ158_00535 [Thaumarchaeota archaeon]|jgi:hypothetical protein|nr:hypothetical protein [Candidatus Terraquivivens yellowstonensis]MCL7392031.1 hypothetical protein [Candidatus Terraquivivens yellowstonensis]MCL7394993.1 hypothetical protein [Candidatus Terraquivivens yellowstonensis]MCL7397787.1 hypothetical protein [Candidatus Terraquivivens yellowstonensis]MCL7399993.1 hypothetical protein [Candidatus Terraquivivens yellowstonensis]
MSHERRTVNREELERIIALCESIEKRGLDPFSVNVKELLMKLRRILEEQKDLEIIILDAETLYKIAVLISLQQKWLKERASSLFIDSQLVSLKITSAEPKQLAAALARSWRPIVRAEQLTPYRVRQGMEYFLMLPPRDRAYEKLPTAQEEALRILKGAEYAKDVVLEDEVRKMHERCIMAAGSDGEVDYWSIVSADTFEETVWRAYVLSFVVSEGLADIKKNPLTGEIKVVPYPSKRTREKVAAFVISLKSGEVPKALGREKE